MIGVWANSARALLLRTPSLLVSRQLEELRLARSGPTKAELAKRLLATAMRSPEAERENLLLDDITRWLRVRHPQAVKIWEGWQEIDGRLVRHDAE